MLNLKMSILEQTKTAADMATKVGLWQTLGMHHSAGDIFPRCSLSCYTLLMCGLMIGGESTANSVCLLTHFHPESHFSVTTLGSVSLLYYALF